MPDDPHGLVARVQTQIDTRAIELAASANALIGQHLIECRDRYLDVVNTLRDLREERKESSRDLYKFLWKIAGSLIFLLLAIIGYLLKQGGLPSMR